MTLIDNDEVVPTEQDTTNVLNTLFFIVYLKFPEYID